jgi:ribosomal protein S18 acetylase RimI-like enzyme
MSLEYRWITGTDAGLVEAARSVFDYEVRPEWARRFLEDPSHHLCLAYDDERVAGFVSGVELVHPDKGVEMFLYELGVDDAFRGKGIGKALVTALADLARERGCYGMWVLTDADNEAALRTYRGGGATETDEQVMLTWRLDPAHDTFADDES